MKAPVIPWSDSRTAGRTNRQGARWFNLAAAVEALFIALRYFALDGTDHATHREQASMIRRYIAWRNRHVTVPTLRKVIRRAEMIKWAKVA